MNDKWQGYFVIVLVMDEENENRHYLPLAGKPPDN